jgi:hypothetical protein
MRKLKGPSDGADIKTRAYHEAGHTCVAVVRGIPYKYVTLIPRTKWDGGHLELDWKKLRAELRKGNAKLLPSVWVMYHAGWTAQLLGNPNSPFDTNATEDFKALDQFL